MLSLSSGGMTSTQAGKYFAQEDYYLHGGESSRWLGKSAETFRLTGRVTEAAFANVAAGKRPDGIRQLVAPKLTRGEGGEPIETRRAGNDLTFSAPKSVSIGYAAGNRELKEIWDQAVVNTVRYVEAHYSQFHGPNGLENAGNILAAKFDHVTSRALDPEVHSHVFLVNLVQTGTGWQANDPKNIYQDKIGLGMLARQEAIHLYRQAGYRVYFTDRERLLFEIEGIRPEEIEAFSKRSSAIAAKVAQWQEEGRFPGVPDALLKQMAALDTRDPKRQVTREDVRREWDDTFAAAGTSADEVRGRIEAAKEFTAPEQGFRHLLPGDYPETLATVMNHTNVVTLKKQQGYEQAKRGGDPAAAAQVVDALVKPEVIAKLREQIPEGAAVYVVPVLQREGRSLNMIPLAYAARVAEDLGGEVWTRIRKISGRFNTGATLEERLHNVQVFDGVLPPENSIIIVVDDTFTVGGTLTALIDHLAVSGHPPLSASTLAVGRYGKELRPAQELIHGLLEKAGTDRSGFQEEFGYPPEALTAAEIRSYLLSGRRGIDEARRRFYTARGRGSPGSDQALEPREPPLTPPVRSAAEVIKKASDLLSETEVVFERGKVMKIAAQLSGGGHSVDALNRAVKRELRFVGRERSGWQSGKEFYTIEEMLRLEARNVEALKTLPPFAPVTSPAEIAAYLKGLAGEGRGALSEAESRFPEAYRAGAESFAKSGAVRLSPGQREYLQNELAGRGGFTVTQGDPGTGKTFVAKIVERFNAEVLQPSERSHHTLNLAYTGKAALELESASGRTSHTIDSFLNRYEKSRDLSALLGIDGELAGKVLVLRIDEASFVGGRQASRILDIVGELRGRGMSVKLSLIGDAKQLQSIQASPFFRHATDLARDGGDYAIMKEITRQKDPPLLQVAKVLNREGASWTLGDNAADALKMLQQQGRVTEIASREELLQATVQRYLLESRKEVPGGKGERQSVLLVTPLNADRRELNARIREARLACGELPRGVEVEVFVPVDQGVTSESYRPGMVVLLPGGKSGRGREGEVVATDPAKNTVTLSFTKAQGVKETQVFEAPELALQGSLYRRERREFSVGDQVVFGKNERGRSIESLGPETAGVRNGERGVIEELDSAKGTAAKIRLAEGRSIRVELTRYGPQHLDHGYAVTVHKGQGETVDCVLSFNFVKQNANAHAPLRTVTGIGVSPDEFQRWNAGLSDFEKGYRLRSVVAGHPAVLSFVMIAERERGHEEKGIAARFLNGHAVVADPAARALLREVGWHWSDATEAWVTPATNDRALPLMTQHPLKDSAYLAHLKETLRKSEAFPIAPRERNYLAELDTAAETKRFGRLSYNSFNVAMTRARHEAAVLTNSVSGLRRAIRSVEEKTTLIAKSGASESRLAYGKGIPPSEPPKGPAGGRELAKKR